MGNEADSAEVLADRQKRRATLRSEFWKQVTNPHRHAIGEGGHIFDPAVQRYVSTRSVQVDYFKPSARNAWYAMAFTIIPMVAYYIAIKKERDDKEHKYRTGQVAYRDRLFKFI